MAIIFFIVAELSLVIANKAGGGETDQTFFIEYNDVLSYDLAHQTLLITYYAFTSLTTVGLGDLHPRSNLERLFVTVMLVLGVTVFSYVMKEYIKMLK